MSGYGTYRLSVELFDRLGQIPKNRSPSQYKCQPDQIPEAIYRGVSPCLLEITLSKMTATRSPARGSPGLLGSHLLNVKMSSAFKGIASNDVDSVRPE
ncbi:hypothetical protein DAPPUDRAFT_234170 [Daphnia pulex]|uniref:Uncharacterized protein n=1 Tax=Daphnia pulex TaxID=6669 RepID=E9FUR5_DAPPU|nr:hypothetical protein DAPPUDRAFT_234170 [Daphnia pulex]|eukprot:EFX88877.1 hypothetical protein DAPPUDRAFT_234170 [Daphnia pulex]